MIRSRAIRISTCEYPESELPRARVAPETVGHGGVLGRQQHGDVPVVLHPGGDGGRGDVEAVVGVRGVLHPAEQ